MLLNKKNNMKSKFFAKKGIIIDGLLMKKYKIISAISILLFDAHNINIPFPQLVLHNNETK